ncbi:MerR family transcriptional regulator [Glycomyces fuscus]|nr:MerR family transcriptional regulator [Glycomyces fuscus]
MSWSTGEVCRMSGVTSRALRHYHRIGLLEPERTGPGGIRHYGHGQLLRLQHILVMRELGMGLPDIARALDGRGDRAEVLRDHLRGLLAERDRIDTLVATVRRTVDALEEADTMKAAHHPEELFAGFDASAHSERARVEWPRAWERARRVTEGMTEDDRERCRAEAADQLRRMAAHLVAGVPPDDPAVQAEVHIHYLAVSRMWAWTPDAGAFENLGRAYAEEGPWREVHDGFAPGLADYQYEAMAVYARRRLDGREDA